MGASLVVSAPRSRRSGRAVAPCPRSERLSPFRYSRCRRSERLSVFRSWISAEPLARGQRAERVRGEADSLVERLEPVGQLELVALVAAEELDARQPVLRGDAERLERRDDARRAARERRVERQAVDEHRAVRARRSSGRPPAGRRRASARARGRRRRRCAASRRDGTRGPSSVPNVEPSGRPRQRSSCRRNASSSSGSSSARVRPTTNSTSPTSPSWRRRRRCRFRFFELGLGRVGGVPAVGHQRAPAPRRARSAAAVPCSPARAPSRPAARTGRRRSNGCLRSSSSRPARGRLRLALGEQQIGERRLVCAEEARHPHAARPLDVERRGADEPPVAACDDDGQPAARAEVAPPFDDPAVQQERARPRHRQHQVVPLAGERFERLRRVERLERARKRFGAPFRARTVAANAAGRLLLTRTGGAAAAVRVSEELAPRKAPRPFPQTSDRVSGGSTRGKLHAHTKHRNPSSRNLQPHPDHSAPLGHRNGHASSDPRSSSTQGRSRRNR